MVKPFAIDYTRRTHSIERTDKIFAIDKKTQIVINAIKILAQDYLYYGEIEYIPEYRAYDIFNP